MEVFTVREVHLIKGPDLEYFNRFSEGKMALRSVEFVRSVNLTYGPYGGIYRMEEFGEQGWRSDESTRLPPMWPGFDSRSRRHLWVEFVVGSLLCSERFFSGYSGFPLSAKTNTFQIPIRSGYSGR